MMNIWTIMINYEQHIYNPFFPLLTPLDNQPPQVVFIIREHLLLGDPYVTWKTLKNPNIETIFCWLQNQFPYIAQLKYSDKLVFEADP